MVEFANGLEMVDMDIALILSAYESDLAQQTVWTLLDL